MIVTIRSEGGMKLCSAFPSFLKKEAFNQCDILAITASAFKLEPLVVGLVELI
jgi:hypothetical protein